jgi:hypothetical protein
MLMSNLQGRVNAGSCSGVSFVLYFLMRFRVMWWHILMPCFFTSYASLTQFLYKLPQGYMHTACSRAHAQMAHLFDVQSRRSAGTVNLDDLESTLGTTYISCV